MKACCMNSKTAQAFTFDPRALLVAVIFCMASTFLIVYPWQLIVAFSMWLVLCCCLGVNPLLCIKSALAPLLFLLLIVSLNLFFQSGGETLVQWGFVRITQDGLRIFFLYGSRLCLLLLYGSALLLGLNAQVCARALQSILSPLRLLRIPIDVLTDVMVLSLRFMPMLTKEYVALQDAQILRGKTSPRSAPMLSALFQGMLRHAENLSLALDSRGYEVGKKRTSLLHFHLRMRDIVLCVLCGGAFVFLLISC